MAPKIGDGDVYQVAEMKPAVKKTRKREIVLQNVVYMLLLHFGAFYGVTLVPRASVFTWLFTVLLYAMGMLGVTAGITSYFDVLMTCVENIQRSFLNVFLFKK